MPPISDTLLGLVSHYSPSGHEERAARWLTEHMKTLGYTRAFVDEAGNAVGVMGAGPRQAVLLGHIDTVPGEIPVEIVQTEAGPLLYGRGSVDAKGPLACFTDAVAQIGPATGWQVVVIGAVEEERNSEGARFLLPHYAPEFLIVGEPNRWERIALGYKGSAWLQAEIHRPQAHTASGEETAAEAAVQAWQRLQAAAEEFNTGKPRAFDQLLLTLREIEAGQDEFEQWARLKVGARLPVDLPPEQWYNRAGELLADAEMLRLGYALPAWACEKNSRLVRALVAGVRSQAGTPSFVYKTGSADLNLAAPAWKCPAAVYGPGDSALDHTPREHLSLPEYELAVRALREALTRLLAEM